MIIKYPTTSRYTVSDDNKEALRKPLPDSVSYTIYVAKDGDTFDSIAQRYFNDFTRFWELADINPHVKFPNKIPVGTVIRIPR